MKKILALIIGFALFPACAAYGQQSTAQPVITGYLSTTGCPGGATVCFKQFGSASGGNSLDRIVTDLDALVAGLLTPPIQVSPALVTTTDRGGTITSGGAAQNAMASNSSRKGWCITNDPAVAAGEILYVRANGTASATAGTPVMPGGQVCNGPLLTDTAAISVFAATTGHRWFGFEVQ